MSSRGYSILLNTYTDNVCDMGVGSGVSYGMEVADKMLDYVMFCDRDYKGLLEGYTAPHRPFPHDPWVGLWPVDVQVQLPHPGRGGDRGPHPAGEEDPPRTSSISTAGRR